MRLLLIANPLHGIFTIPEALVVKLLVNSLSIYVDNVAHIEDPMRFTVRIRQCPLLNVIIAKMFYHYCSHPLHTLIAYIYSINFARVYQAEMFCKVSK